MKSQSGGDSQPDRRSFGGLQFVSKLPGDVRKCPKSERVIRLPWKCGGGDDVGDPSAIAPTPASANLFFSMVAVARHRDPGIMGQVRFDHPSEPSLSNHQANWTAATPAEVRTGSLQRSGVIPFSRLEFFLSPGFPPAMDWGVAAQKYSRDQQQSRFSKRTKSFASITPEAPILSGREYQRNPRISLRAMPDFEGNQQPQEAAPEGRPPPDQMKQKIHRTCRPPIRQTHIGSQRWPRPRPKAPHPPLAHGAFSRCYEGRWHGPSKALRLSSPEQEIPPA